MKKKLLVLTLCSLSLTACNIAFSDEVKDEGFEDDSNKPVEKVIEYFNGDTLDTAGHTAHVVTFKANDQNSQPVLSTNEEVMAVINDADHFVTGVSNISNISQFHGLKIGNLSNLIDGTITFILDADVYGVEILARPRSNTLSSMEAVVPIIDKEVALNVNDSKYIKVNCDFQELEDITDTKLSYIVTGDVKSSVTINAIQERAEIMQITFYE